MTTVRQLRILWFWLAVLSPLFSPAQEPSAYTRAEAFVRQGHYDRGIALLRQLLDSEPRNLKALNLLGIALTQKGDLAAANREYAKALQVDPRFPAALKNLAINEFTLKEYAASEKHFREAGSAAPDDPVINAFLGRLAFSRNDFAVAAAHLAKAGYLLTQDPSLFVGLVQSDLEIGKSAHALSLVSQSSGQQLPLRTQFELGLVLAEHNYFEQAAPRFEAVQAKFPASYDASFNLAVCYVETKRYEKAITILTDLRAGGHKTAELDNLLAEAYKGADQVQPAIDALHEATRLAPEDENNYIDLVALCIDHDAFDLGFEVLDVGLHFLPQSDRLIFQRGVLHAMRSEFDLAEQDFQLASQLAPEKNLSYVGLGVSYMQAGNLPEAVRTLRDRVRQKPGDPTLLYLFGDALMRSGAVPGDPDFSEARNALERSVRLNTTFVPSRVELAKVYLHENRVDEAVALLERARTLDPGEKAVYSQLLVAFRRQKKPDQAAAAATALARLIEEQRTRESHTRTRLVKQGPSETRVPE
jgi:tetratricopeptide (TPR) repeat protein